MDHDVTDIQEGFICPICHVDQKTLNKLLLHESVHNHTIEDETCVPYVTGFFNKAKVIFKQIDPVLNLNNNLDEGYKSNSNTGYSPTNIENKNLILCHGDKFDRFSMEGNKLSIRLEKLILENPHDSILHKMNEKKIVPWVEDDNVKLCPSCAKSFTLSKRRHHCRLCGYISCNSCSNFLNIKAAEGLIMMISGSPFKKDVKNNLDQNSVVNLLSKMQLNDHLTVFKSTLGTLKSESFVRICLYCKQILEKFWNQYHSEKKHTEILKLYNQLQDNFIQADQMLPHYFEIMNALENGSMMYTLNEAQTIRRNLLLLAQQIDDISKKIEMQPKSNSCMKELQLHRKIRLRALCYLKENLVGIPSLPSEEDLIKKMDDRRQIEAEKLTKDNKNNIKNIGWMPVISENILGNSTDPINEQIHIIENYLRQAKRDHKFDEAKMLKENLIELQERAIKLRQSEFKS